MYAILQSIVLLDIHVYLPKSVKRQATREGRRLAVRRTEGFREIPCRHE